MTRRRSRRPRKPRTIVEEVIPEEEVALDEEEAEEFDDEEEEEAAPPPRRRRRKAPLPEPEDTEEEEAAPTRRRRRRTTVKDAVPDVTPEAKIGQATAGELMEAILQVVEAGHSISVVKIAGKYVLHRAGSTGAVRSMNGVSKAMTRKSLEEIAYSDEFKEFHPEWAKFTYEEKVGIANDEGVSWDHHENPKVDVMRLTAAVRVSRGVEKWRPEYRTRDARKDLRDHGILADALNDDEFADEE